MTSVQVERRAFRKQNRRALRRRRYGMATPRKATGRWVLVGVAALVLLVIVMSRKGAELRREEVRGNLDREFQELVVGLLEKPYVDPEGLFAMVPPGSWYRQTGEQAGGYDIVFRSPNGPDISIMATPVEDDSFPALLRRIDHIERELGLNMNIETDRFNGHRAVKRTAILKSQKVLALDFAYEGVAHHLQFAAHPDVFDRYLPAVMDVLATYEPRSRP